MRRIVLLAFVIAVQTTGCALFLSDEQMEARRDAKEQKRITEEKREAEKRVLEEKKKALIRAMDLSIYFNEAHTTPKWDELSKKGSS